MNRFEYAQARSVAEALDLLAERPGSLLKAGGIDCLDHLKEHLLEPSRLVDVKGIAGLRSLHVEPGASLRLGPLVTLAAVAAHPGIRVAHTALAHACAEAASPQIRNVATLGGNLLQRPRCWYYRQASYPCLKKGGDTCFAVGGENRYHAIFAEGACHAPHPSNAAVALLALDATLTLEGRHGTRRVGVEQFFRIPHGDPRRENAREADEILTAIEVPSLPRRRSIYASVTERAAFDWPLVSGAVALVIEGGVVRSARIALGAVATVPRRAPAAERAVIGRRLDESTAEAAAQAVASGAQLLAENGYKLELLGTLLRRTLRSLG